MATPIPHNEVRLSLTEILAATGGRLRGNVADRAMQLMGVSTDTRTVRDGELFVALTGERFDGHDHLGAAAEAGAALALVERAVEPPPGLTLVEVASTLEALRALASLHLERWRSLEGERRVVALTGSAGKTTTKAVLSALLAELTTPEQVWSTPGNLNNLVGVPMVIFALTEQHRYAVLELGTNQPGEIAKLARMVHPDAGLITLVAPAHSKGLGDVDAIAREKGSLFDELNGKLAVGNVDNAQVRSALMRCDAAQRVGYGRSETAQLRIVDRRPRGAAGSELSLERDDGSRMTVTTPLIGEAGALAVAAAVATLEALLGRRLESEAVDRAGMAMVDILAASEHEGRLTIRRAPGGVLIVDDSYNANPASAASSLAAASELAESLERRLIVVMGEMRELGEVSLEEHRRLGERVADSGAALVVGVCGDARAMVQVAEERGVEARYVDTSDEAARVVLEDVEPDDLVLVKGSRGVRTERVVEALMATPPGGGGRRGTSYRMAGVGT